MAERWTARRDTRTGAVESRRDAFKKLWWNRQQYEYARTSWSEGGAAQGYALIDYAVAESALHSWVVASLVDKRSVKSVYGSEATSWSRELRERVQFSVELRSLAVSAKHIDENVDYGHPDQSGQVQHRCKASALTEEGSHILEMIKAATRDVWYVQGLHLSNGSEAVPYHSVLRQNLDSWQSIFNHLDF